MSDHVHDCPMAGSYSVTTCPCCGRRITPARRPGRGWLPEQEIEARLRERPPNRLFDVDGEPTTDD
jgi:hypothetical protein